MPSPLELLHDRARASFLTWGPPEAGVRVPAGYAELELEYAAIRKSAALMDEPQRGTLTITGADRLEFLNRMVTQELKGMATGDVRATFWLSRKGRIDADLRLIELGDRMLAAVDIHAVARALEGLSSYVITEDVTIADSSAGSHHLALHGPAGATVLAGLDAAGVPEPGRAVTMTIAGASVVCYRDDTAGVPGYELIVPAERAEAVYMAFLALAHSHAEDPPRSGGVPKLRPVGWHAYNIARIEAGTPLYNIDFGPDSLPAESGVLHQRVSFKKGCYLGQEIVARMESRGHSKRTLVRLMCDVPSGGAPLDLPQPVSGSRVFMENSDEPVGEVTSSTPSPQHSLASLCLAALKPAAAVPGTRVMVEAESARVLATVHVLKS
jgi:folate-binding protein YgfZ